MLIKTLKLAGRLRTGSQTVLPLFGERDTHVPLPLSSSDPSQGLKPDGLSHWTPVKGGASSVQSK